MCPKTLERVDFFNSQPAQKIVSYFQPIVSVKEMKVIGVEALSRGVDHQGRDTISPQELFCCAEEDGSELSLDRECSTNALESFVKSRLDNHGLMLFVNMHSSVINTPSEDYNGFISKVYELGLNPSRIAVEIPESMINDERALEKFLAVFKYHGFIIALDDVGKGYSNLNRIPVIKPFLIKIDRSLVINIENDYYKQEVFKSLSSLGKNIGAIVVAEGVETEEEALMSLELGADFLQGFFFVEPRAITNDFLSSLNMDKVCSLARILIKRSSERFQRHKFNKFKFITAQRDMLSKLEPVSAKDFDAKLKEIVHNYEFIESAYVLSRDGRQITDAVYNYPLFPRTSNAFFSHSTLGSSHRFKEHFYVLKEINPNYYQSNTYISHSTGNHCVTISSFLKSRDDEMCILCIDFIA